MCVKPVFVQETGGEELVSLRPRKADFIQRSARGSLRRRVWELETRSHCPIIGICFSLQEVRNLLRKAAPGMADGDDFELHATLVQECGQRSRISEVVQRELEKRYALAIKRSRALTDRHVLAGEWRDALASGKVAAALWTTLTHPACDPALAARVYADVHMLQHQLGASERVSQQTIDRLQQENLALSRELALAQRQSTAFRDEQVKAQQLLREELAATRSQCAGHEAAAARYYAELSALRERRDEPRDHALLVRRTRLAEARNQAMAARLAEQERALERTHAELARLQQQLRLAEAVVAPDENSRQPCTLAGCHVLCVGGRTGAASLYRRLVEEHGGRFTYHDGGMEESLNRLEASIAAADAVICQAGCISHNAYWRVKEHCKRTGKRCTFLRSPSVSAFLDGLVSLGRDESIANEADPT